MRVATYARYSSDLQDGRSIDDQEAALNAFARSRGWDVVAAFSDAAASGASLHGREGLARCIARGRSGEFTGILVESLDRISRSLADTAALYRDLGYHGIKLLSVADNGEIPMLMLAVKAGVSEQYLIDLAQKTRRGQAGRVKAGRIPGGKSYGYDLVTGEDRGRRTINEFEAAIIRRVFTEFAEGRSPLAIVADLNREGVRSPRGGRWNASTITGSRKRANGILSNELYIGRITYNRQSFVKDPATGKRQARPNPRTDWQIQEVPELRVVDQALWDAVQARRRQLNAVVLTKRQRCKHMLSGLLKCGECGESYILASRTYLGCSGHRNKRTCSNRRTIAMGEVEDRVLYALQQYLLTPEVVAASIEVYRQERRKRAKDLARQRGTLNRELGELTRKIDRLVQSIQDGADTRGIIPVLNAAIGRREAIEAQLRAAPNDDVGILHPNMAERYRQKVAEIHGALRRGDRACREAIALIRGMVQQIVVRPSAERMELEVVGDLAALLEREQGENPGTTLMVAGVGFEPTTFRL